MTSELQDSRCYRDVCPVCNKQLTQKIIRLLEGGFIYLERCPANAYHYEHLRFPNHKEAECGEV